MSKLLAILLSIIMFLFPSLNIPKADIDATQWNTNYTYVFVHGLSGWGEYDAQYKLMPYWGMFGGDLMKYLNARGFDCHGASVAPTASAWDRACELYAQLTGTVTDYGVEHSERCHHERFGPDYTDNALIESWSATDKINLLGHSFGGATILTLADLMANGSEAEMNATDAEEISELFTGGKADWIYSLTTLAAPMNGTTAYNIGEEVENDDNATAEENIVTKMMNMATAAPADTRIPEDTASYDMNIDNAHAMLEGFTTLENAYYFSIPCSMTDKQEDGTYAPDKAHMEILFQASSARMGRFTGVTPGGIVIDESWQENDGLVNTISAKAPFNAPQKEFDANDITTGIWNIMPTYRGDHMSLEGGLFVNNNVRTLYIDHLCMINSL